MLRVQPRGLLWVHGLQGASSHAGCSCLPSAHLALLRASRSRLPGGGGAGGSGVTASVSLRPQLVSLLKRKMAPIVFKSFLAGSSLKAPVFFFRIAHRSQVPAQTAVIAVTSLLWEVIMGPPSRPP